MRTSEYISKIAPALLAAQKAITFAVKDTANPFFKSKYADLPCVIDAIKAPLNDAGIVFLQSASPSDPGYLSMTTRLLHTSGEWIEDTATVPLPKSDPQGYGSASTYARRYALAAITGLYQDDDDGNAASHQQTKPEAKSAPAEVPFDVDAAVLWIKKSNSAEQAKTRGRNAWTQINNDDDRKKIKTAVESFSVKEAA